MKKRHMYSLGIALFFILAVLPSQGQADYETYHFYDLTNNGNPDVGSQLTVQVADEGLGTGGGVTATQVLFKFTNPVGIASSICDVYFDDGTLLGIAAIRQSAGVAFNTPATPADLPGGNNAVPPFEVTDQFSADSDPPAQPNGVNAAGEWLGIVFDLQSSKTYADVIAALGDGSLRIGLHVQAIGPGGGSDSYVNRVPVPAAFLLGMLGLGYAGMKLRKFV
jgi:hypothetical protein